MHCQITVTYVKSLGFMAKNLSSVNFHTKQFSCSSFRLKFQCCSVPHLQCLAHGKNSKNMCEMNKALM